MGATATLYLTLAFLGGLAVWTVFRPPVALVGVLVMFMLEQWALSGSRFFALNPTLINYCVGGIVMLGVTVRFFRGQLHLGGYPPAGWFAVLLIAWVGMTYIWSLYPDTRFFYLRMQYPYLVLSILAAPMLISNLAEARQALVVTGVTCLFLMFLILFTREWGFRGMVYDTAVATRGGNERSRGAPLSLASAAGRAVIIALLLPLGFQRNWAVPFRWCIVLLAAVIMFLTQSRGQVLAVGLVCILLLPLTRGGLSFKSVFILSVGFVFLAIVGYFAYSYGIEAAGGKNRWADLSSGTGIRSEYLGTLYDKWFAAGPVYWVLGIGNSASYSSDINGIYPHFVALEVLAEEGLVGFTLFSLFVGRALYSGTRMLRLPMFSQPERNAMVVVFALFAVDLLLSCKQGSLLNSYYLFLGGVLVDRLAVMHQRQAAQYPAPAGYAPYPHAGATA